MVQSISVLITKGLAIGLAIVPIGDLRIVPSRIDPTQEFSHTMGNIELEALLLEVAIRRWSSLGSTPKQGSGRSWSMGL